jgi:hypothetical protein
MAPFGGDDLVRWPGVSASPKAKQLSAGRELQPDLIRNSVAAQKLDAEKPHVRQRAPLQSGPPENR